MRASIATRPRTISPLPRGILFDLDGTLVDSGLDFDQIRREMGLPSGVPILETVETMSEDQALRHMQILDRHEQAGGERAVMVDGVATFLEQLDRAKIRRAIVTRNARQTTFDCLQRVGLQFDTVMAREDAPPKPDPEALWMVCRAWEIPPSDVLMIGDFRHDIEAGQSAGMRTVLLTAVHDYRAASWASDADFVVESYTALTELLFGH
ncbi:MAG: HAD family hydrolase [Planctomycetales bacterium]|nr:HAD family hydrolase [Planctomycetales bacterium]